MSFQFFPMEGGMFGVSLLAHLVATALLLATCAASWAMTNEELTAIRDGYEQRRDRALRGYLADKWHDGEVSRERGMNQFVLSRLCFAIAAMSLDEEVDRANAAVGQAIGKVHEVFPRVGDFELHWPGSVFYRLYAMFGPEGTQRPGRLSQENAAAIRQLFAEWAKSNAKLGDADPAHTWYIWGSENHHAMHDQTAWAAAQMLKDEQDFVYDDGSTPAQQYAAWVAYLKEYLRERVRKGMLVEYGAAGYGSRTLQTWHNYYDFSEDAEMRRLAAQALTVWWADWAQEQIDGVRGGGKVRLYQGASSQRTGTERNRAMAWYHLGMGTECYRHDAMICMTTSSYRLPLVVMDIALDVEGRGVYECKSRRPGKLGSRELSRALTTATTPMYVLDSDFGGIFRYTYCTPDFVMGTSMLENRPHAYWSSISSQNRWHGVVFRGHEDSRIFPQCIGAKATYNQQWSVQSKGTLIAQKLRTAAFSKDMRVWFSSDLKRKERGGWVFAEAAGAYAAVRVVRGGYAWDDENWLRCEDEYTPVIIEVARKSDYDGDFDRFQAAVLARKVELVDGVLRYRGLGDSGEFTFYAESDRLPEIDGRPIDLRPDYTFDSPFVTETWAGGVVTIKKGDRKLVVDVGADRP